MSDIAHHNRNELPATGSLIKATLLALLLAAAVLVLFIIPAEYGIDATGLGSRLGLNAMSAEAPQNAQASSPSPVEAPNVQPEPPPASPEISGTDETLSTLTAAWKSEVPYRNDQMSLTLQPAEGAEIKARMRAGERFVFSWTTEGGVVNFDMHGEAFDAKNDEFTSFWKGRGAAEGHGAFVAPFDGTHGWYWRNRGNQPVTVTVKTSGFYERLFRP
jgi:hypothetical protein